MLAEDSIKHPFLGHATTSSGRTVFPVVKNEAYLNAAAAATTTARGKGQSTPRVDSVVDKNIKSKNGKTQGSTGSTGSSKQKSSRAAAAAAVVPKPNTRTVAAAVGDKTLVVESTQSKASATKKRTAGALKTTAVDPIISPSGAAAMDTGLTPLQTITFEAAQAMCAQAIVDYQKVIITKY